MINELWLTVTFTFSSQNPLIIFKSTDNYTRHSTSSQAYSKLVVCQNSQTSCRKSQRIFSRLQKTSVDWGLLGDFWMTLDNLAGLIPDFGGLYPSNVHQSGHHGGLWRHRNFKSPLTSQTDEHIFCSPEQHCADCTVYSPPTMECPDKTGRRQFHSKFHLLTKLIIHWLLYREELYNSWLSLFYIVIIVNISSDPLHTEYIQKFTWKLDSFFVLLNWGVFTLGISILVWIKFNNVRRHIYTFLVVTHVFKRQILISNSGHLFLSFPNLNSPSPLPLARGKSGKWPLDLT